MRSDDGEHDGQPLAGQPPHRLENLGLGRDVDAARRLVEQQHRGRVISRRAITTFCWLPPLSDAIGAVEPRPP